MKDFRSKKVAIVANCILNQNSKVIGFAKYKGMVKEIVDLLYVITEFFNCLAQKLFLLEQGDGGK